MRLQDTHTTGTVWVRLREESTPFHPRVPPQGMGPQKGREVAPAKKMQMEEGGVQGHSQTKMPRAQGQQTFHIKVHNDHA